MEEKEKKEKIYDTVIIGGGPAGLTAALYAARNGMSVKIVEKNAYGGNAVSAARIENIPGFVSVSGEEFADGLIEQVMGTECETDFSTVRKISKADSLFTIQTDDEEIKGKTVILATGTEHRRPELDNIDLLEKEGLVSYCAICDGYFFTGKDVIVIGGGNTAFAQAELLAKMAKSVTIVCRSCPRAEKAINDSISNRSNVRIINGCTIKKVCTKTDSKGRTRIEKVILNSTGGKMEMTCDGIFAAIGQVPSKLEMDLKLPGIENNLLTDYNGYYITDENCMVGCKGLFAAGDIRKTSLRQVVTACADGARAAMAAAEYIS